MLCSVMLSISILHGSRCYTPSCYLYISRDVLLRKSSVAVYLHQYYTAHHVVVFRQSRVPVHLCKYCKAPQFCYVNLEHQFTHINIARFLYCSPSRYLHQYYNAPYDVCSINLEHQFIYIARLPPWCALSCSLHQYYKAPHAVGRQSWAPVYPWYSCCHL